MTSFATIIRRSILAISIVTASAPAFAGTADNAPTIAVSYAGIDLSSTAGQQRLHRRLTNAARAVCEGTLLPETKIQPSYDACVAHAMAQANTEVALLIDRTKTQVAVR